jgi:hypothetical protein
MDVDNNPYTMAVYSIVIEGAIDETQPEWFGDVAILVKREETHQDTIILRGVIADQVALRAILSKLWDQGFTIIAVKRVAHMLDDINVLRSARALYEEVLK